MHRVQAKVRDRSNISGQQSPKGAHAQIITYLHGSYKKRMHIKVPERHKIKENYKYQKYQKGRGVAFNS